MMNIDIYFNIFKVTNWNKMRKSGDKGNGIDTKENKSKGEKESIEDKGVLEVSELHTWINLYFHK